MIHTVEVTKGRSGFEASTKINLGNVSTDTTGQPVVNGIKVLEISTRKGTGGILSYASVYVSHGEEGFKCKTFAFTDDYMKTLESNQGRCTEKSVKELHEKTMSNIDSVLADVDAFYARKVG